MTSREGAERVPGDAEKVLYLVISGCHHGPRSRRRCRPQGRGHEVSGDEEGPGARIARARRRRGLAQSVLAGLADRSESWLSQVERGCPTQISCPYRAAAHE